MERERGREKEFEEPGNRAMLCGVWSERELKMEGWVGAQGEHDRGGTDWA